MISGAIVWDHARDTAGTPFAGLGKFARAHCNARRKEGGHMLAYCWFKQVGKCVQLTRVPEHAPHRPKM